MKKGDIVEITFFDHMQNAKKPEEFVAWGRVFAVDKKYISLHTWAHPDSLECDTQTEGYTIVRSCITSSRVLV